MKTVSILIPNRNSREALKLTIESIRFYTDYPYKIIVYDDCSTNDIDIPYLKKAESKGWLKLYQGENRVGHGGVLNELINKICDTDYAVVMDSDTEIKGHSWVKDFLSVVNSDVIAVVDIIDRRTTWKGYNIPVCDFSFGFLNMELYRDNMDVDWRVMAGGTDRRQQPYKSIFADIYPPDRAKLDPRFDENFVSIDPGGKFWLRAHHGNPKGYKMLDMPAALKPKYHHHGHISYISVLEDTFTERVKQGREAKFRIINKQLEELRCQS